MRRLLFSILALWAMPVFAQEPKTASIKTIQTVEQSVVPIVCARPNAEIKQVIASGFLIDRQGHFVTAGHVIKEGWNTVQTADDPCAPAIFEPQDAWSNHIKGRPLRVFFFTECLYGNSMDIAVCKTIDNPFGSKDVNTHIRPISVDPRMASLEGTPVAFTGFPLTFMFPVTSKGYVGGYAPFSDRLVIDKSAWPGASGSPVYNSEGSLVGMITDAGINYGSGLAYALPINSILRFLADNKVPVEK